MNRAVGAAVLAVMAIGAPAHADATTSAVQEAQRLISASGAPELFEDVSKNELAIVRHKPSGVQCFFEPGERGARLTLFPNAVPGEDVGCSRTIEGVTLGLYVTRYAERPTAEQVMASAIRSLQQVVQDAKPYRGEMIELEQEPKPGESTLPKALAFAATGRMAGEEVFSLIRVRHVGPWSLKVRATAAPQLASKAQLLSGMSLMAASIEAQQQLDQTGASAGPR